MTLKQYLTQFNDFLSQTKAFDSSNRPVDLDDAVNAIVANILGGKGKVMMIGNGGSASIASHIVVDLWKNGGVKALAFNDISLVTCVGNDYGFEHIFAKPIGMFADKGDILFAISSSGRSANIINGVNVALAKKCSVITLSGFSSDNPLLSMGEINFYVPSDSYGFVETAHSVICHSIADIITSKNKIG